MKFWTILFISLGCLFSCMLLASCEDSPSQISVNERLKRDVRRRHSADSNESDDRDDDDDDETRKEYSRRLALQQVIRKLRRLPLSRRQLIKLVSRLRMQKKSNKPITMTVLKDIMKEVVATKSKAPGVKVTIVTPKTTTTTTTTTTEAPRNLTKHLPSITDGQLISVQKAPKKPAIVEVPKTPSVVKPPTPPKPKPTVYSPPVIYKPVSPPVVQQIPSKQVSPKILNPYIPPPKIEPPVLKIPIPEPPPKMSIPVKPKTDVQVVPLSDGSNLSVDTRITPELKLNIDHIPVHMRTQALFQRLSILKQRLSNFKKLRERQSAAREPVAAVVKTSLSGGNTALSPVLSIPKQAPVSAIAYSATAPKSSSLSSPNLDQSVPYVTKDQTQSVLQTQTVHTSPAMTKLSNLSSPPMSPPIASPDITQDETKRVKKIILVIQRLASRSGSKKLKVSAQARDLLIKWVRKYKHAIGNNNQPAKHLNIESTVQYSVKPGHIHVPIDQVGTKSLHSNIPLSSTAEMANPQMMENDIIKQKIHKSGKRRHKSPSPMIESSKDTYISDSSLAKSHFKSSPKKPLVQELTSSKPSQQTVVENSISPINSAPSSPVDLSIAAKVVPVASEQNTPSLIHNEKENNVQSTNNDKESSDLKATVNSNKEKEKIESIIDEAPEHIQDSFLPPVIEDQALQTQKVALSIPDSSFSNASTVVQTPNSPVASPTDTENIIVNEPAIDSASTITKMSAKPIANEKVPSLDIPTEKEMTPQSPAFTILPESEKTNFVEANLDLSPYKTISSTNTENQNEIKVAIDNHISETTEHKTESNITPLFPKHSQNTFYKNEIINNSPTDTIPVESNLVQTSGQISGSNIDETSSKSNSLPVFQKISKNTFSDVENVIDTNNDNKVSQSAQVNFVVSAPEPSNTVPIFKATKVNTFEAPESNSLSQTKTVAASTITSSKIAASSSSMVNVANENPNIQPSLPGVVIDTALLDTNDKPPQQPQQDISMVQNDNPTFTPKTIQEKLEGVAVIVPNDAPVQVQHETNVIAAEPKATILFDINSSSNQKNVNMITPSEVPSMKLPPLSLKIPPQSPPSISKLNTRNNVPNTPGSRFQTQSSNVPTIQNNIARSRTSNSFAISRPNQKTEIDINRVGRTSLDKSAILRKLLEIRRMREQLIATGRVSDRRLSDLFPRPGSSLSNPSTVSRPQQSASLSQNSIVFWGDRTKPSLTNPQGISRAHRKKRSLLSPPNMLGNMHVSHHPHHQHNQMFSDMPLHSLSYNKRGGNRVDLYGGLGSLSGAHPYMEHHRAGSLSGGHPNAIHDIGMTKLGKFFQKPVNFAHQPEIPNIASVVNRIFAPGQLHNSPQLFAGMPPSVYNTNQKAFRPNGSVRRPSHAGWKSGFSNRQNFVQSAPVKLQTSNTHGVRISVTSEGLAGSLANQQRQGYKRTIDTSFTDNSLALGIKSHDYY